MINLLTLLLILLPTLCGCGTKIIDPNYSAMLAAHERQVERYAGLDRAILKLEVGDTPLTLPPGAKLTVNSQLPELTMPTQYRDYLSEAWYQFAGNIVSAVLQPGIGGLFNWLIKREDRKSGQVATLPGIDFRAAGDINFSGGIGDNGQRGYSPTITPAPVINNVPTVIPPVITNTATEP